MDDFEEEARRFLEPDETAAQLLARTFVQPLRTGLPLIDRHVAFRGGQVLEIASAAGAGRTTALLQVAASCILPAVRDGVAYGGRGGHVLLFDLDGKLDIVRLLEMLDVRINRAQVDARVQPDEMPVVHDCLTRLHVVRCHSSFDFLAALRTLRPTVDALASAPGGLACLLIDNLSAFYYLDRAARGAPAGYGAGSAGRALAGDDLTREGAPLTLHRVWAAAAAELRALQRRHRVPVIATKHLLLGAKDADRQVGDSWPHRELMPKPWQDLVTHRLLLRTEGGDSSGGSGSGGHVVRQAKWHTPDEGPAISFDIDEAGILLC